MRVAIYGSRPDGHAKVLADLLADIPGFTAIGLVDDFPENRERRLRGLAILGGGDALSELRARGVDGVMLGFGEASGRLEAIERVRAAGLELPLLVHGSAVVSASAVVGAGCQILAGAHVGADARLADGVLINTHVVVEHDARLGAGSVVAPGVVLAGRASVGAAASIGAGATILPDVVIGEYAVVAAGAVVTRDVAPNSVVVGVPARERGSS
jgi:UDP-perosamine 4-acetyltransferase